jgi:NADH-quinone oxidoreductase subunit E
VPDGTPVPDRIGHEGAMGTPASQQATESARGGAAPLSDAFGPQTDDERTDLPPNITRPDTARGWDRAADLEKDPAVVPDPADVDVPPELRDEIEEHMRQYPDRRSAVIPALHAAQRVHGWCSPEALQQVGAVMQVTPAYLSSIASFYDMLNEEPLGRHAVYVCTSVSCALKNPERVLEAIQKQADEQDLEDTEIREFECLGACDMAPMASVDGRYVGPLETSDAAEIVAAMKEGRTVLPGRGLEDADYRLPWGGRA